MTVLKFALAVEQVTTQKKANLILNVDGCIAVCFVDMMQSCGAFSNVEADELVKHGCLNGAFLDDAWALLLSRPETTKARFVPASIG